MAAKRKTKSNKKRLSGRLQFSWVQISLLIGALLVVGIAIKFLSHASQVIATVEAETLTLPSGSFVLSDPTASPSTSPRSVEFTSNGTASGQVSLGYATDTITIRAKGSQCKGSPIASVSIDGLAAGNASVSSTSWANYSFSKALASGAHTITITYTNDFKWRKCDRNLFVDNISFLGTIPTTTPTPTPTSSVPKIYGTDNFIGWGAESQAKSLLAVNGDRLCQDDGVDIPTALPSMATNHEYLTLCLNSYSSLETLATNLDPSNTSSYPYLVKSQVATYGPSGSFWAGRRDGQYAVPYFELMNEPYGNWYRGGDNDPVAYAKLASAAIQAGKAANPYAKFFIPLTPTQKIQAKNCPSTALDVNGFCDWNLALVQTVPTLFQQADGFTIHHYPIPTSTSATGDFATVIDNVKNWAWSQSGGTNKPFLITEANLSDHNVYPESNYVAAMPQFVQIAQQRSWVSALYIFNWHGYNANTYCCSQLGFINASGTVMQTRADAYRNAIQPLTGQ